MPMDGVETSVVEGSPVVGPVVNRPHRGRLKAAELRESTKFFGPYGNIREGEDLE